MRIMVVENESDWERKIKEELESLGETDVECYPNGQAALNAILNGSSFDVAFIDQQMPSMSGTEFAQEIHHRGHNLILVMITAFATMDLAVEALRKGFYDFVNKSDLKLTLNTALARVKELLGARKEIAELKKKLGVGERILGESPKIKEILELIQRVAQTDARVLITGESGTGKELVARAMHQASKRSSLHMVEVNCAAIPAELIESELFGHEKGSFTGATAQRIGKFEQADGGTLFLDEIGDMSLAAQAKVLRALEEGKIERVGGNKLISVNVRVIAATNKNLPEEIKKEKFREDLFHRLNVIPIQVPPLRERREDIPVLVKAFVEESCARNGMAPKSISEKALQAFIKMEWRGNVRELRNIVERLVIMTAEKVIEPTDVEKLSLTREGVLDSILQTSTLFQEFKDKTQAAFIKKQLEVHDWNVAKTAKAFDISVEILLRCMKQLDIKETGSATSLETQTSSSVDAPELLKAKYQKIFIRLCELEEGHQAAATHTGKSDLTLDDIAESALLTIDFKSSKRRRVSRVTITQFFDFQNGFGEWNAEKKINAIRVLMKAFPNEWLGLRQLSQIKRIIT